MKIPVPNYKKQYRKKKRLKEKADKLWHIAGFKEWGNKCFCGADADKSCHHFFPKGLYSHLRYDVDNAVPICFHHHFSRHHKGDPSVHQNIIELRGKIWHNRLKRKAKDRPEGSYLTLAYYQNIINLLKEQKEMPMCDKCFSPMIAEEVTAKTK